MIVSSLIFKKVVLVKFQLVFFVFRISIMQELLCGFLGEKIEQGTILTRSWRHHQKTGRYTKWRFFYLIIDHIFYFRHFQSEVGLIWLPTTRPCQRKASTILKRHWTSEWSYTLCNILRIIYIYIYMDAANANASHINTQFSSYVILSCAVISVLMVLFSCVLDVSGRHHPLFMPFWVKLASSSRDTPTLLPLISSTPFLPKYPHFFHSSSRR